ncbi:MAG: divergent polysaccharide deacetylase family protein [Proteobacteria bacterium]|nr:divergent polysaccharide deacetylase family protein [Pseudomonadota bacterium]
MRNLVIAWVVTLSVFVGVIAWLQISYEPDPERDETVKEATIAASETAAEQASPSAIDEDPGPMPGLGSMSDAPAPTIAPTIKTSGGPAGEAGEAGGSLLIAPAENGTSDLVEEGPYGPIPVTRGGRQPWRVHALEYSDTTSRPRIAIVISGLGLNRRTTEDAITNLPPEVTLAFSPYGQNLRTWTVEARRAGHELLVMVPMEPLDYPVNDPGPHSLLTSLSPAENIDKLHYVMSRFGNYVGLMNDMGSRFTASEESLRPLMSDLQRRGVIFVDARTTGATIIPGVARSYGVPTVSNSRYIDNVAAGSEIDRYLAELEDMARARGSALGIGRAYPVTIARVAAWSMTLAERGINLAPVTAIVRP